MKNNDTKTDNVYIIGHKNPDSDSICSAIAYANLKNITGTNSVPARLGKINRETEFILNYFGVAAPIYLSTVKTQVSDLDMDRIDPVLPGTSIRDAWLKLKENSKEVLPVETADHVLTGLVSVSDIAGAYMSMPNCSELSASGTPVENVIRTLNAELIYASRKSLEGSGKVVVAAMSSDGLDEFIENKDVVFTGNIKSNQKKAIESGASCVITTCGTVISEEIIRLAKEKECTLLSTKYDTFSAARLIYQSIPVSFTMTSENLTLFHSDDFLDDVKDKMLSTRYRSYPVVDVDNHFLGFISRYHLLNAHKKKIILVDHSETSQSVNGIEQAEIMEIVDHHRIGGIQTGSPIFYRNEATGSTAAIIASLYSELGITPSPEIAGILCAAIISDTIRFRSPTSTNTDFLAASRLSKIAGIDIDTFSTRMFDAGLSIKNFSTEEIVLNDFKEYSIGKYKVGIGQVNTTELRSLKKMRSQIMSFLEILGKREQYNIIIILFTDIIEEETEALFVETQKGLVARAFSPLLDESSFHINGVVSRKKQIVPKLVSALS